MEVDRLMASGVTPRAQNDPTAPRASYACNPAQSRGRLIGEPGCTTRGVFQRDRDRVVHSSAFRRLTHKTQVFIYHEGDHYRTRLTHTIEVAQIARAIARQLRLDEDLAEAIALAHDLGHPPFGHAGERALDREMAAYGGFDHNAQSLNVVTRLERRYADFDGLNLSWETLEGIVKHNGPLIGTGDTDENGAGVNGTIAAYNRRHDLELDRYASLEAQVAALADDIAYSNHDMDDGLRAGLITLDMLEDVPIAGRLLNEVHEAHPRLESRRIIYEVNRRLITRMILDAVGEARTRLAAQRVRSPTDVRAAGRPLAGFSAQVVRDIEALRAFLFETVYRHDKVMRIMNAAETLVAELFRHFMDAPGELPESWRAGAERCGDTERARMVADYVAGMTDRYALLEHRRLFDATPELR